MNKLEKVVNILMHDAWFCIFAGVSILLIIASFFLPPMGVIDSSVFAAVGEIFGFAALYEFHIAVVQKGMGATIHHNDTTIEINKDQ